MNELFKTVVILSFLGFGIITMLLILKPITAKRFPAKWQYYAWIVVLLSMLIPIYKLIPDKEAQKLDLKTRLHSPEQVRIIDEEIYTPLPAETATNDREVTLAPTLNIRLFDLLPHLWLAGVLIYIAVVGASYTFYLFNKQKNSLLINDNIIFDAVKAELNITRRIKLKTSPYTDSPMLSGVLFPVVYIPCRKISDESMRMIFLHELTHYKRGDLIFKWLAVFANALHWFNPFAYLLRVNLSEACEVSCDMEVTKNMSGELQKIYMNTILDLVK